jgi:hypothetical protein
VYKKEECVQQPRKSYSTSGHSDSITHVCGNSFEIDNVTSIALFSPYRTRNGWAESLGELSNWMRNINRTMTERYENDVYGYGLYMGYDLSDKNFNGDDFCAAFKSIFGSKMIQAVLFRTSNVRYQVGWKADYMAELAYWHGYEYLYQVSDDMYHTTYGWAPELVNALRELDNVGIVSPHGTGPCYFNHHMLHRSHFEIFGVYTPHMLRNTHQDVWLTELYWKAERAFMFKDVKLYHANKEHQGRRLPTDERGAHFFSIIKDFELDYILEYCKSHNITQPPKTTQRCVSFKSARVVVNCWNDPNIPIEEVPVTENNKW